MPTSNVFPPFQTIGRHPVAPVGSWIPDFFTPHDIPGIVFAPVRRDAFSTGGARLYARANNEYHNLTRDAALEGGEVDHWISAHLKLTAGGVFHLIAGADTGPAGSDREFFLDVSSTDVARFGVGKDSGTNVEFVTSTVTLTVGVWYSLFGWYDASTKTMGIIVDDNPANTATSTGTTIVTAAKFTIGGRTNGGAHADAAIAPVGFGKPGTALGDGSSETLAREIADAFYGGGTAAYYGDFSGAQKNRWGMSLLSNGNEFDGDRIDQHGGRTLTDNATVTSASGPNSGKAVGGDPIGGMLDARTGNQATQSNLAFRPMMVDSLIDGRPGIRTDSVDDYLLLPDLLTPPFTAFIVYRRQSALGTAGHVLGQWDSGGGQRSWRMFLGSGVHQLQWSNDGSATAGASSGVSETDDVIAELVADTGSFTYLVNGSVVRNEAQTLHNSTLQIGVGARPDGAQPANIETPRDGIVLADRALNADERRAIRNYLGNLNGISL